MDRDGKVINEDNKIMGRWTSTTVTGYARGAGC